MQRPLSAYSAAEVDALFDEWDDGSGRLDYQEINKTLRRGADVQLAANMQAGAMGEIKLKAENKGNIYG